MARKMLINARTPEELRIAIVDGSTLEDYQIEVAERGLTRGNIYRGIISSIQPSLNAAFIDYGSERNGFLPIQDVVPQAYYRQPKGKGRPRIDEVLERGKPIIVQVNREPEQEKGATLTTNLSLAGRYLVLRPFADSQGVSRKVEDEETRKRLKEIASKLSKPSGCGFIVRTNALDQSKANLNRDLNALLRLWKRVSKKARSGGGIGLIYSDQDLILRTLRDSLDSSVQEVLTDDDRAYTKAKEYMRAFMPRSKTKLVRYSDRTPLFTRFNLETQIERIYDRRVELPSGGSIVIESTEALVTIDVNSGRSTRAGSQEETAVHTNLEAAREVARQLRLRDIGGLVVVDFIDMWSKSHQRKVEKAMRDALKADKARSSIGRISPNGLLEINRQKIQQALHLRTHRACPTCAGTGRIASPEMVGLNLLRRIEAHAADRPLRKVVIALHPELADAFQNDRRHEIAALEKEFGLKVEIIASNRLHRSEQEIEWVEGKPESTVPEAPKATGSRRQAGADSSSAAEAGREGNGTREKEAGEQEEGRRPSRRRRRRRGKKSNAAKPAQNAS